MAYPILLSSGRDGIGVSPTDLWGIPTLEGRRLWRLLPSKPTSPTSLRALSYFLDEWQRSLLDIPLDALITGANDLHSVVDSNDDDDDIGRARGRQCDWETELFRTCWSEIAHLTYRDECDTGSLVLLPDEFDGTVPPSLTTDVVSRDGRNLVRPMRWLGRDDDWEIVAMERGTVAVRLLFKLGDIPELER